MDRKQFMNQLSRLLWDIPEGERKEALDYYNSYFDDAGPENESAVIQELGSPGKVAAIIKAELRNSGNDYGEYTERGFRDTRTRDQRQMPGQYAGTERQESQEENRQESREERRRERQERHSQRGASERSSKIILIIIGLVFLSPILAGAVGGIAGGLITLLLLPFILVFAFGAAAVGLLIAGVATAVAGIITCVSNLAGGIFIIGIGLFLFAIGLLFLVAAVWIGVKTLPWLIRKVTDFLNRILHKERGGAC